jgi:deazaflavin-dependent oxidoreductase (nitroreductase family)
MTVYKIIPDAQNSWLKDHVSRYLATDGADGYWADFTAVGGAAKAPNLILTVTGRRSGKAYRVGLIFGEFEGRFVIVGSKGGAPEHPAWYLNLIANPDVLVQIKERKFHAQARVATGDERATLWTMMNDISGGYADIQKHTAREFPVVVLEPVLGERAASSYSLPTLVRERVATGLWDDKR